MRQPLIHPKFQGQITSAWPSKCTIQTVVYTTSASNQKIQSGAVDIGGMIDIPCRLSAKILQDVRDNETRTPAIEAATKTRILKLNGYFPSIVNRTMQAVVDGIVWKIRGSEADSQTFSTRLQLEIIKP